MLRFQLASVQSELDSVTQPIGIATAIQGITGTIHTAHTAITVGIHIPGRITTLVGPTTIAAIDITSITSVTITTATKRSG